MKAPSIENTILYLNAINSQISEVYKKVGAVMAYLCGDEFFIKENFNKKGNKMNEIIINNVEVKFEVVKDEIFTNSLQIAEVFEKRHADVLRVIENLPNDDFRQRNFAPSSEVRKNGVFDKETKLYNLTRDGFSLLVMSFTGEKAYKWKTEYIKAFNKMEAMLRDRFMPHDLPTALRLYANELEANNRLRDERDEAIKTKAYIGSKREATAMATASLKSKEVEKLKVKLDESKTYATIKKVEKLTGKEYNWRLLKAISEELNLPRPAVEDINYGEVKSYHEIAWKEAYNVDLREILK
ncbi:Rha family transcriptional regulator [Campylobacter ureolyticus]|uniref:Rha family transcriptional regulator n=1 Tax=Campylobacter ureolyticus TaxID=827 RepID=UPI00290F5761|nr:Rha family transcriptional regulator [Campylobacter ureolyticus]MDU7070037.1 Rha family transcriptional regulator [Campylobacter ureolyticus]